MAQFFTDLRLAFRVLLKEPGFTGIVVLALALGIGANTVVFSAFNALLLRPLPYPAPDRLVTVWDAWLGQGVARFGVDYANMADVRERNHVFAPLGFYVAASNTTFTLTGAAGPERVQGARASADFFKAIAVAPFLGRPLQADDELPARNHVVVLGHALWQRYFSGDPALVGRTVRLNDEDYEVVGIMPPGFEFPSGAEMPPGQRFAAATEVWTPLTVPDTPAARNDRVTHYLRAVARLKDGVTLEQAQAELATITAQLVKEHPAENDGMTSVLTTVRENQVGEFRPALLVLLAAVALVLLIACANIANLLLARASVREKEFTIRAALGASRGHILRQLLTESLLLAAAGGAAGLGLAFAGTRLLVTLAPAGIPRISEISIDGRVGLFTAALALLTGVLAGLAPALHAARSDLNANLKDAGRGSSADPRAARVRGLLVIGEVTLVFVLLVAAGLMMKSFRRLLDVAPGFDAAHVLSARVTLAAQSYPAPKKFTFYRELVAALGREPGATAAAIVRDLPLSGTDPRYGFSVAARPADPQNNAYTYRFRVISADYFTAMGVPLKRGRFFDAHDDADAPGVVLISETAARLAWPGQDPLGQVILTPGPSPAKCTVVGLVGDVKFGGLDTAGDAEVYYHYPQIPPGVTQPAIGSMAVVVRTAGDPRAFAGSLRRVVAGLDKDVPVSAVKPMDEVLAGSVAARRFNLLLLGGFAGAALLLAAVGIFGVISYWVTQRTREIGIRLALGATSGDILRLTLGRAMAVVLAGLGLGGVVAGALGRVLPGFFNGLLFGVQATDPVIFAGVAGVLAGVALLASYLPARRAIRVQPTEALRTE